MKNKPKVMLHYILPPNTSGPNTAMNRISQSWLENEYEFCSLVQNLKPGKTFNLKLLKDLMKQIKKEQPDLIHATGLQSAGFYAVLAAKLSGNTKVITTIRGSSVEALNFHPLLKLLYKYVVENITMYLSTAIYTVSYDMSKKFSIAKKKNFCGVIHNPAPLVHQLENNNLIRKELGISKSKRIVLCVSRMTYDKGISYAIEAIKKIEDPNLNFIFVGDGPYNEVLINELNKEIEDGKVFILGKRNDVSRILSESDIFLFPTLHENLSNALLEACAYKLCVIATNVGGNPEVIKNQESGLLIDPKNSDAIVDSLNHLMTNEYLIEQYSNKANETVNENFSQKYIYSQLNELYKKVLIGSK